MHPQKGASDGRVLYTTIINNKHISFRIIFMRHRRWYCLLLISLLAVIGLSAQTTSGIRGLVYDELGEPVIGATVRAKADPSKGTTTNLDGQFTLPVKAGDVIIISYVGYKTVELPAQNGMEVHLQVDSEVLDDVVVIGYMTRKITNTSASVVKISAKELSSKPNANPLDAIQGKVSGLQVYSNSGEPSQQLSLALHGQGSLGAGTGPLFILDGMPISTAAIRAMNPNDFESM